MNKNKTVVSNSFDYIRRERDNLARQEAEVRLLEKQQREKNGDPHRLCCTRYDGPTRISEYSALATRDAQRSQADLIKAPKKLYP
jgi:hypothetical protein